MKEEKEEEEKEEEKLEGEEEKKEEVKFKVMWEFDVCRRENEDSDGKVISINISIK